MKNCLFIALILLCAILLTACGDTPADTPTTTTAAETTTTIDTTTTATVETTTATTKPTETTVTTKQTVKWTPPMSGTATTAPTTAKTFVYTADKFHTDVHLRLKKTAYAIDETVIIDIENNSDDTFIFDKNFAVLIPDGNGRWLYESNSAFHFEVDEIKPGTVRRYVVNLSSYSLKVGEQHMLLAKCGDKWASAAFTVLEAATPTTTTTVLAVPDPFTVADFHTNGISLQLDRATYGKFDPMSVRIEGENILTFDTNYTVLKVGEKGELEQLYPITHDAKQYVIRPGQALQKKVSLAQYTLSDHPLEPGQTYKFVWFVEDKWVGSDFTFE